MDIEIREYNDDYYQEVSNILKENFNVSKAKAWDSTTSQYVALKNNVVVGYFIIRKLLDIVKNSNYLYLEYVCVKKAYQNQGIGKEIMKYIVNFATKEKVSYIELTSNYKREVAHHLYEEFGFEKRESYIYRRVL